MLLGVVFACALLEQKTFAFILFLLLILGLLTFCLLVMFCDKLKKYNFLSKFAFTMLIGLFISFTLASFSFMSFSKNEINLDEKVFVSGRVEVCNFKSEYVYIILEQPNVYSISQEKDYKISGRISLTVHNIDTIENLEIGNLLSFLGTLTKNEILEDGKINTYYYKNNLKYHSFADGETISVSSGEMHLDEKFKEKVKSVLYDNLSYDNASLAYACIFGDNAVLNKNIYDLFAKSGTAHIIAVSGINIAVLITVFMFLFNLCKLKKKYSFIILCVILLIYSYLCGFAPSVVRSSLMGLTFIFASIIGERNDNLSSLSLAGIIILLFKPLMAFDLGFQLSFASCLGIFLLMPSFQKLFRKIKFSNKFTDSISLTLAAQIGTFPILLHSFEKMSFLSLLANLIIVPLFEFVFIFTLICLLFNFIFGLEFLFFLPNIILKFIMLISNFFGSFNVAMISTEGMSVICNVLFYLIVFGVSKFLMLKHKFKFALIIITAFIFAFSFFLSKMPSVFNENTIINLNNSGSTIITNSNNLKIMLGLSDDESDIDDLKNSLKLNKIYSVDVLVLTNYNEGLQNSVVEICNSYNINKLYLNMSATDLSYQYLSKYLKNTEILKTNDDYYTIQNISFKIYEKIKGVYLNILENDYSTSVLVTSKLTVGTINYMKENNIVTDFVKTSTLTESNYLKLLNSFQNSVIICDESEVKDKNLIINCNKFVLGESV